MVVAAEEVEVASVVVAGVVEGAVVVDFEAAEEEASEGVDETVFTSFTSSAFVYKQCVRFEFALCSRDHALSLVMTFRKGLLQPISFCL